MIKEKKSEDLVGVGKATHARHNSEHVVVSGVHANLGGLGTLDTSVGEDKLKSCIIDSRKVASSTWLVLLRSECERVYIDTSIRVASVMLVRLHQIKVGTLAL